MIDAIGAAAPDPILYPAPSSLELIARKGQPGGYAALDPEGLLVRNQLGPEVWPLFQKRYFIYDPNVENAGPALMAALRSQSRGANPPWVLPPGLSNIITPANHYPLFTFMFADNANLWILVTPGGKPVPCIIGMATWNGDLDLDGAFGSSDFALLDTYAQAGMIDGDLNNDGVCNADDYAVMNELAAF